MERPGGCTPHARVLLRTAKTMPNVMPHSTTMPRRISPIFWRRYCPRARAPPTLSELRAV